MDVVFLVLFAALVGATFGLVHLCRRLTPGARGRR